MSPLRLLYAIQTEQLGGAELHAIDLARRMAERGHHVTATCRPGAAAIRNALALAAAPLRAVHRVDDYVELAALIDALRPDVMQHFNAIVAPAAIQRASHEPCSVQIVHANHLLDGSTPAPAQATDVLVAVSESAASHYPLDEAVPPVRVIRNGIDTHHFTPAAEPLAAAPVRLLCASRLDEAAKRTAQLVALCAGLDDLDWRLTVVGDGPDRETVERVVRDRDLQQKVDLIGHRDDLAPHYRAAHVFLSYSTSEGFGRSLAEAASAGLAVVARHCHGVSDLLERAGCALVARSDAEFARALRAAACDPALRAQLGGSARRFALQSLDVRDMVDAYERLYRELVRAHATPRAAIACSPW